MKQAEAGLRARGQRRLADRGAQREAVEVLGDDVTQERPRTPPTLRNAVGGISDIIHVPGLVNVDFEDVKTVMSEPGKAMMHRGGLRPDRAHKRRTRRSARCSKASTSPARGVLGSPPRKEHLR
jgi:cell division protein FtsZ